MKLITFCVPMYNESENLKELYRHLDDLTKQYIDKYKFEFLFINDGSIDDSLDIIKELAIKDRRISYVDLSRNFGKEVAMLAGFDYCKGDATIIMDADLQHPPSTVPSMITEWENGYQDVYGKRVKRGGENFLKKATSKLYYKILGHFSQIPVLPAVGDFRLLDRKCIDSMVKIRESQRYTKSMYMWIGFKKKEVEFESSERFAGQTKWKLKNLIQLAIDGIVSDSKVVLRLSFYSGIIISLMSFVYMLYVLIKTLTVGSTTPGFPTLTILILFLSGSQLIFQGVMGEYIGKIYTEVKNRPPYLIQEYYSDIENEMRSSNTD
ncbi:glycosyltransferase family 2 protein [Vagococcus fluvialis]|uniref:glycosyltransferase family 2 protein n=1 Tax=Vagococcus fluvialis TaxID=2738 RepID=UPI001A903D41|nr:glycosyltransferase family 2 protein [Vagococcus fluvialis]MBO0437732.1 glycosyltransferase family 2 protein [Vagococcus fluvialis]